MRVTFLIGNGFDLNLGLNTRYTDFYPIYVSHPFPVIVSMQDSQTDLYLRAFQTMLKRDGEKFPHWADFERAMGKHTFEAPLNEEASLRVCLQDFKRSFAAYLRHEEGRIDFKDCGAEMSHNFFSDLDRHLDYIDPLPRGVIKKIDRYSRSYRILDFNYTTVLDRLISYLDPESSEANSLEQFIHIHGTHSSGMILGVDNIGQVANPDLFTTPLKQRLLLKPLLNQQAGPDNDRIASECIRDSDEICIFGMSLGETDLIWWQRIGEWLTANSSAQLLIFTRSPALDPLFFEDALDYQNMIQDLFFSRAGLPAEAWDPLRERTHIALNSNIFQLHPIMKDFSASPDTCLSLEGSPV